MQRTRGTGDSLIVKGPCAPLIAGVMPPERDGVKLRMLTPSL
jgi:hypothetical protein